MTQELYPQEELLYEARHRGLFRVFLVWLTPPVCGILTWAFVAGWGDLGLEHRVAAPLVLICFPLAHLEGRLLCVRFTKCGIIHRNAVGKVRRYDYADIRSSREQFNRTVLEMNDGHKIRIGKGLGDPEIIKTIIEEHTSVMS